MLKCRDLADVECPVGASSRAEPVWGSDIIAAMLRGLELDYICINPGDSCQRPA